MEIFKRPLQPENALVSIVVKFLLNVTFDRLAQLLKASDSITVTVSGITISSNPVHPLNNVFTTFDVPDSNTTFFKLSQSLNGPPLLFVFSRLFGISISVRASQSSNALFPRLISFLIMLLLTNYYSLQMPNILCLLRYPVSLLTLGLYYF